VKSESAIRNSKREKTPKVNIYQINWQGIQEEEQEKPEKCTTEE
jgi:hypothetical protein